MLKRSNTWDLQPEVLRRSMSSQRDEGVPAQANGGLKAPCFRYELPPRRWDRLGVSIVAHTVALIVLVQLAGWLPKAHEQRVLTQVTPLYVPKPQLSHPPKILPPPPRVLAKLQPPPKPTMVLPEPTPQPEPPKIEPPKVEPVKPQPPVEVAKAFPAPDIPKPVPQPKKEVVVNTFDSGSSAKQTVKEPLHKVQTGGFGDPNGVVSTSDKKSAVQLASLGSFDRPAGPGDGNGTAGKHGTPGTVAPAGFGDGIAAGGNGDHGRKAVNTASGFGDASPVAAGPGRRAEAKPDIV